jgi:hypothetical protein
MTREHILHKAEFYNDGRPPLFSVWCSAGDLDLAGLTAELAERWVEKHSREAS